MDAALDHPQLTVAEVKLQLASLGYPPHAVPDSLVASFLKESGMLAPSAPATAPAQPSMPPPAPTRPSSTHVASTQPPVAATQQPVVAVASTQPPVVAAASTQPPAVAAASTQPPAVASAPAPAAAVRGGADVATWQPLAFDAAPASHPQFTTLPDEQHPGGRRAAVAVAWTPAPPVTGVRSTAVGTNASPPQPPQVAARAASKRRRRTPTAAKRRSTTSRRNNVPAATAKRRSKTPAGTGRRATSGGKTPTGTGRRATANGVAGARRGGARVKRGARKKPQRRRNNNNAQPRDSADAVTAVDLLPSYGVPGAELEGVDAVFEDELHMPAQHREAAAAAVAAVATPQPSTRAAHAEPTSPPRAAMDEPRSPPRAAMDEPTSPPPTPPQAQLDFIRLRRRRRARPHTAPQRQDAADVAQRRHDGVDEQGGAYGVWDPEYHLDGDADDSIATAARSPRSPRPFTAPAHGYLSPGYIHARTARSGGGRIKSDPVKRYAAMQRQWENDARRAQRRRRAASSKTSPMQGARQRRRTSRTPPQYVPPTSKRRDRLRLEVRSRMLAVRYGTTLRGGAKSHPSLPSAYVIPSDNPRKGLRWGTRVAMMS